MLRVARRLPPSRTDAYYIKMKHPDNESIHHLHGEFVPNLMRVFFERKWNMAAGSPAEQAVPHEMCNARGVPGYD